MELDETYLQLEFPIENLEQGTIIEVYFLNKHSKDNGDLLVICEHGIYYDGQKVVAISILNGGAYSPRHSISSYKIKSFRNRPDTNW